MNTFNQSDELDNVFSTVPISPDEHRKKHDKQLAMEAFREGQQADTDSQHKNDNSHQGMFYQWRQTFITLMTEGDKMTKRWIYSGAVAAVFLVAMSVTVINHNETEFLTEFDGPTAVESETSKRLLPTGIESKTLVDNRQQKIDLSDADSDVLMAEREMAVPESKELQEIVVSSSPITESRSVSESASQFSVAQDFSVARPVPIISSSDDRKKSVGEQFSQKDKFSSLKLNSVKKVTDTPVSTFSIDVDTSSYSYVRSQLNTGVLPKKNAVRLEELVNYFDYQYPTPKSKNAPFESTVTVLDSPWRDGNKLVHIGIKGYQISTENNPKSNLVFLLDVSGSMNQANKLPLVKQSFELMLSQLKSDDTVAIVTYAGQSGVVLAPTKVSEKSKILQAIKSLRATGSTGGAQGIQLAYELAESQFDKNAVNRIILATDGDFNVGVTHVEELKGLIERKRETGIFLSVLGFGRGNYHDHLMQELAQNGNGVAAYIDTLSEAQKVLVEQSSSLLFAIAKDVKIQVEFNPETVAGYRLLGYETRALSEQGFNNDNVDAGEIGSGHTVTAIYEITPVGSSAGLYPNARYDDTSSDRPKVPAASFDEYGYLKIRYKLPQSSQSTLIETPIYTENESTDIQLHEARFSIAVAGFSQLLTGGTYLTKFSYDDVIDLAQMHKGDDLYGYRSEFIQLVRKAKIAKDLD